MNEESRIEKSISKLLKKSLIVAKFQIQQFRSLNEFGHVITKSGFIKEINLHPYGVKPGASVIEKISDYNDFFESRFLSKRYKGWSITSLIQCEKNTIVYPGILTQIFYNPDIRHNYISVFKLIEKKWGGFFSLVYRDIKVVDREVFEGKIEFDIIFEKMKKIGYEFNERN